MRRPSLPRLLLPIGACMAIGLTSPGCGDDGPSGGQPDSVSDVSDVQDTQEPDATEPDATEPDAIEPDATEPDAVGPDATEPDAIEDAALPDAEEPDAVEDTALPDAEEPDAIEDAAEPDAEEPDATEPDATEPDAVEDTEEPDTIELCGNGVIDEGEACDGAELGGETCVTLGFAGGELACAADCLSFETAGCVDTLCGNGTRDEGEACDGDDLGEETCVTLGFDEGELACDDACGFVFDGCSREPWPQAGEIIITEIMQDPNILLDDDGEWFELYNLSDLTLSLNGCEIRSNNAGETFMVKGAPVFEPGAYMTFARSAEPGFEPDYVHKNFTLANGSDLISIVCYLDEIETVIDTVHYDGGPKFPDPTGASMQLDPEFYDAELNDDGANWCQGRTSYNGDLGTPGAENESCTLPTFTIGGCRIQYPDAIADEEGLVATVYGWVYAEGLTDLTPGNDPHVQLVAQLGYGADGTDPTDPEVTDTWTWINATPNPEFDAEVAGEPEVDEYQASFTIPTASGSPYDYAFRFSGDGGETWTYCDTGEGSLDGYQVEAAGTLVAAPSSLVFDLFFSEYVEGSSNNKALEIFNAAETAIDVSLCTIKVYPNGSTTPNAVETTLSGTIPPLGTLVVCHSQATSPLKEYCELLGNLNYNGDDAVALVCNGQVLDVIGKIGQDPGTEWGTGLVSTADNTLRRKCMVQAGDPDGSDDFDPSIEWDGYANDTFDGLGEHCPPEEPEEP